MFNFSKQFYTLFLMTTFIPICLITMWNIYSINKNKIDHIHSIINIQTSLTESNYYKYLEKEKSTLVKLLHSNQGNLLNLNTYKKIFQTENVFWIDEKNDPNLKKQSYTFSYENYKATFHLKTDKNFLTKESAYFDLISNVQKPNSKSKLVSVFIIPLKNYKTKHKGILIIKNVPYKKLNPNGFPLITRVYLGTKFSPSKLLYINLQDKPFKASLLKFPPKKVNIRLESKKFTIKNHNNNTIATVEIGVPEFKKPLFIFPVPVPGGSLSSIVILGLLIPVLGLLFSLVSAYYLKKHYLTPIEKLSEAAQQVILGNLKVRIDTNNIKSNEIKHTLENFNSMVKQIQEKEELKDNFIANLTHDFKTPIIAANRAVEILLEEITENTTPEQRNEQKKILQGLFRNNQHLLTMINLLLETYQFKESKIELKITSINLDNLLKQCFNQLESLISDKNINLVYINQFSDTHFMGDYNYFKRCFLNLILNSIENIPQGSTITVYSKFEESSLKICFKDNGPGIPEELADKLFDKYYSGKSTERKLGSGLGLYISKKIIEAHGGSITLDSVLGKYTNFIVTLPLK